MAQTAMLVQVDGRGNHNKFYEVSLADSGQVTARWGRVGVAGQSMVKGHGEDVFRATVRAKERRGYQRVDVVDGSAPGRGHVLVKEVLRRASMRGLAAPSAASDGRVTALIDRLVDVNAHEIGKLSGGQIQVKDGQVTTPVGLLSSNAIAEAMRLLAEMRKFGADVPLPLLERYLTLVPQAVPRQAGWYADFFSKVTTFDQQDVFLTQLRDSVAFAVKQSVQAAQVADDADVPDDLFRMRLKPVDDAKVIAELEAWYVSSAKRGHRSSTLRLVNVYELDDPSGKARVAARQAKVGNVRRMWHGTRAFNVLSILSNGLVVPRASASHVTGRMFGDGVYFSETSTKALNYSHGYWSGARESRCFMLVADVAMGWEYRPSAGWGARWSDIHSGRVVDAAHGGRRYDSVNVKAGTAGVVNHEAIVWDTDQVALRYLCEFAE